MFKKSLQKKIKKVRSSIIAIGFNPAPNQITITGSGFCVSGDGKILTAAHIYNQTPPQYQSKLIGMAMVKQEPNGLEHYRWLPLHYIKKDDKNDLALFQIEGYEQTLLKPLQLDNSDNIAVGQEAYFIGFPYAAQLINEGYGITLVVNQTIISNIKQDGIDPLHPRNWFIVDAISNPGNSGCPIVDIGSNKVIGVMSISFRTPSVVNPQLDIKEPMHIAGAKPINLVKPLLV